MIAKTLSAMALSVVLCSVASQIPSPTRSSNAGLIQAQSPTAHIPVVVRSFTVRDFQPQIDRTGPINWIARNPQNPSEVFVSSIAGGLWRSTDGGNNWAPIRSLPSRSVSAVAYLFDGTPGGAVLVSTREDFRIVSGAGVWRSDDHGESWTQVGSVPSGCAGPPRAHGIAVKETIVWVATSCGILSTADGARSFSKIPIGVFPRNTFATASERFYSVEITRSGRLLLGGEAGFFRDFRKSDAPIGTGLFGNNGEMRRAFGITPSTSHPNFVLGLSGQQGNQMMGISSDDGQSWIRVPSDPGAAAGAGGSPFVRIFPREFGSSDVYVYYANTNGMYRAGPFVDGDLSPLATDSRVPWTTVDVLGHIDPQDIDFVSFSRDVSAQKLLFATDGGLGICDFSSRDAIPNCAPSQLIGPPKGLSAIEVMNVKGQIIGTGESALRRLYINTWHDDKWASPDNGVRWQRIAGEAAWLEMERHVDRVSDSQIVYNNNALPNILADDLMSTPADSTDPRYSFSDVPPTILAGGPASVSPPLMLQKGMFMETAQTASNTPIFVTPSYSQSTIATPRWTPVGTMTVLPAFSEPPILAGYLAPGEINALVYQPYAGRLAVITGLVAGLSGGHLPATARIAYPSMTWFGNNVRVGVNWTPFTGFGSLAVLGADPVSPTHIVISDTINQKVMRSVDAGNSWTPLNEFSNSVLQDAAGNPTFKFCCSSAGNDTIVSAISFFPEDPSLVIAGTTENGLFFSTDRAVTWRRIPNTEHITSVVSFYWRSANSVIVGSWGRGLFEIGVTYTLPRSSLGLICGDCRFLPAGPRVANLEVPRFVPVSHQSNELQQLDFDEAVLVVDGHVNGAEVNRDEVVRVQVTTGSSEYRFGNSKSNTKFAIEERSGFVGFKGLPEGDHLRTQKQFVKGLTFKNGRLTGVIYGAQDSVLPQPPSLGPVVLPKDTNPNLKDPFLRIFGPGMVLSTIAGEQPLDLQGLLFQPNSVVELSLDGQSISQLRTDATGQFATRLVSPSAIGPHEIVAQQLIGNQKIRTAVRLHVNNSDGKEEKFTKNENPKKKEDSRSSPGKKEDLKKQVISENPNNNRKDDRGVGGGALVVLPKVFRPTDLIDQATVRGGAIQLLSTATPKDPEAKLVEWSGISQGDQLTFHFDFPSQVSLGLYVSVLRGPQTGSLRVLVNGTELGLVDLNFERETVARLLVGQIGLRPGTNTITFVAMPANKVSKMRVSLLEVTLDK